MIQQIVPVLTVQDIQASIQWYERTLGFETGYVNRDGGDEATATWNYALLDNEGMQIHLCKTTPADATLSSASNCYVYVDEIQNLHARLADMGADVTDLQQMPWGTECWLHDPDGNRLVLSEAE